ncbi:MAG: hypothetical protein AB1705_12055 [Verrucomicrobiota bacterium]
MASEFDGTDFVDSDFQAAQQSAKASTLTAGSSGRPPSREELDAKAADAQQRLAELKRTQEELERERSAVEEARRRRTELATGREEMTHSLERGLALLTEAEFATRREAEQMARTIAELRDALSKVQAIHEESWTAENWNVELTRALTTIENSRMEWNSARLKWPVLDKVLQSPEQAEAAKLPTPLLEPQNFGQLCRIGFALTWPVALVLAIGFALLVAFR